MMKYYPLTTEVPDTVLAAEYKAGREIGGVTLGDSCMFFKVKRKVSYVPYSDISRAFRRVQLVGMRMCCGKGDLEVENIVVCGLDGDGMEKELAQVQLPGARAGLARLEELENRVPGIEIGKPKAEKVENTDAGCVFCENNEEKK